MILETRVNHTQKGRRRARCLPTTSRRHPPKKHAARELPPRHSHSPAPATHPCWTSHGTRTRSNSAASLAPFFARLRRTTGSVAAPRKSGAFFTLATRPRPRSILTWPTALDTSKELRAVALALGVGGPHKNSEGLTRRNSSLRGGSVNSSQRGTNGIQMLKS